MIISSAQGNQGYFIISAVADKRCHGIGYSSLGKFTDRTINHPGLAEAAAPAASPLDFDSSAVMNYFNVGYNWLGNGLRQFGYYLPLDWQSGLWDFGVDASEGTVFVVVYFIQARHIDAGEI